MKKRCPSCGETKAAAEFGRNRNLGDGLSFYCLECNRERNRAHYRKRRKAMGKSVRDLSWVPDGFRWCPTCEQAVAVEDYIRNSAAPSGFGGRCKRCHNMMSKKAYWVRRYGISREDVDDLRSVQRNRCAICGDADPQHLDHDHETGRIRQLLCQRCNHGLGLFRDEPALLHSAAFYVQGHRERQVLGKLFETFVANPEYQAGVADPPVGSHRDPDRPRGDRVTGRKSGARRRKPAGEDVG